MYSCNTFYHHLDMFRVNQQAIVLGFNLDIWLRKFMSRHTHLTDYATWTTKAVDKTISSEVDALC